MANRPVPPWRAPLYRIALTTLVGPVVGSASLTVLLLGLSFLDRVPTVPEFVEGVQLIFVLGYVAGLIPAAIGGFLMELPLVRRLSVAGRLALAVPLGFVAGATGVLVYGLLISGGFLGTGLVVLGGLAASLALPVVTLALVTLEAVLSGRHR